MNQRNAAKQRAEERKHGQEKSSESNADSAKFNQKLPKKKKIFKKNNENDHQDEPHRYSSNGEGSENDRLGHPRSSSSSAAESSTGGSSRRKYSDEAFSEKSSNRESSSSHASDTSSRRRDIAAEVAERRSLTTSRSSSSESLPRSDLIKDEDSDNYDNKPVDNSSLDQPIIKSRALPPAVNKKLDLNASLSRESVKSSSILDEQPKSTPPANVAPPAPSARSSTSSGAWSVSTTSLRPSQSTASAPTETVEEAANTLSSQPAELIFTSSIHQQPTEAATTEADDESSDSDIISKSDLQSSRASEVRNSTRDLPSIIKPPIEKPVSKSSEDLPSGSISPPDDIESVNEAAGVDESGDTLLTSFKQHEEVKNLIQLVFMFKKHFQTPSQFVFFYLDPTPRTTTGGSRRYHQGV